MMLEELCAIRTLALSDIFQCVAEISDVVTRFDWYYPSCPACYRKIDDPEKHPYCDFTGCKAYKRKVVPLPWYRFTVRVTDGAAVSRFVLLGMAGEAIVGAPAHDVASKPNPNQEDAPPHIMAVIGKRYLFTVVPRQAGPVSRLTSFTVKEVDPVPPEHPPPIPMLPTPAAVVPAEVAQAEPPEVPAHQPGTPVNIQQHEMVLESTPPAGIPSPPLSSAKKRSSADPNEELDPDQVAARRRLEFNQAAPHQQTSDLDDTAASSSNTIVP